MKQKKILKNNKRTQKYLEKLPNIYIVGCWARWGARQYKLESIQPWVNPGTKEIERIPYVWNYNDHNGAADQYELIPIYYVTTGIIRGCTFEKGLAEWIAKKLNEEDDKKLKNAPLYLFNLTNS